MLVMLMTYKLKMKATRNISSSEENEDEDIMNSSQNIIGSPCSAASIDNARGFSCPYFPVFGLNTVNLHIQSEYRKIKTRKSSMFGHFSCSEIFMNFCDLVRLLLILQSNLSIADML